MPESRYHRLWLAKERSAFCLMPGETVIESAKGIYAIDPEQAQA